MPLYMKTTIDVFCVIIHKATIAAVLSFRKMNEPARVKTINPDEYDHHGIHPGIDPAEVTCSD